MWNCPNCLQDVKFSQIAIYKDEFRRMNCRVFLIFTVFLGRRFLFSLPAPSPLPLTRPISSSLRYVSKWCFREQIVRSKKTPALQARCCHVYGPLAHYKLHLALGSIHSERYRYFLCMFEKLHYFAFHKRANSKVQKPPSQLRLSLLSISNSCNHKQRTLKHRNT